MSVFTVIETTSPIDWLSSNLSLSRNEANHWAVSVLVALLAHMAFLIVLLPWREDASADAGAPGIMVEFAPQLTAPMETPSEAQPGPPQPEPASEQQHRQEKRTEPQREQAIQRQAALDPEIALPVEKPKLEEEQKEQEARPERPPPAALPQSAVIAPQASAPAPGQVDIATSRKIAEWQLKLVNHLERFKRYPREARPAQGIVNVAFTIDRKGHIVQARVVKSSGSPLLDADALALVHRAAPLPEPPNDTPDAQLSQVAPVRYMVPGG